MCVFNAPSSSANARQRRDSCRRPCLFLARTLIQRAEPPAAGLRRSLPEGVPPSDSMFSVWAGWVSTCSPSKGVKTMSTQSTEIWVWREGSTNPIDGFDVEASDGSIGKIDEATYETGW